MIKALFTQIIPCEGLVSQIITDRGSGFTNYMLKAFCRTLNIPLKHNLSLSPQSNGKVERTVKTASSIFRKIMATEELHTWHLQAPLVSLALNLSASRTTQLPAFVLARGRYSPLPLESTILGELRTRYSRNQTITQFLTTLQAYTKAAYLNKQEYSKSIIAAVNKKQKPLDHKIQVGRTAFMYTPWIATKQGTVRRLTIPWTRVLILEILDNNKVLAAPTHNLRMLPNAISVRRLKPSTSWNHTYDKSTDLPEFHFQATPEMEQEASPIPADFLMYPGRTLVDLQDPDIEESHCEPSTSQTANNSAHEQELIKHTARQPP